jgi:hypothetical protein
MSLDDERWYNIQELCKLFPGLTPGAIYAMRHRGVGPRGVRVGRNLFFPDSGVKEWLQGRSDEPQQAAS